tara:strand:- start:1063 stop:1251 length:189 start_codon:yes stop_codon:yes gene_type:complete
LAFSKSVVEVLIAELDLTVLGIPSDLTKPTIRLFLINRSSPSLTFTEENIFSGTSMDKSLYG